EEFERPDGQFAGDGGAFCVGKRADLFALGWRANGASLQVFLAEPRDGNGADASEFNALSEVEAIGRDMFGEGVADALESLFVFGLEQPQPGKNGQCGQDSGGFEELRAELLNVGFVVFEQSENIF